MKHETRITRIAIAGLLLGIAMPAHASEHAGMREPCVAFNEHDRDGNGYLSMEEFKATGKDDLSFRAADIDGDGRVDSGEFDKYVGKDKKPEARDAGSGLTPGGY